MDSFDDRMKVAIKAAKKAGKYLMDVLPQDRDINKKGVVDLVTEADYKSEKMIYDIITQAYPDDRFLAEEGTVTDSGSDLIWIVDPLDGTINYAHRFPFFCVSIALVKENQPLLACIYNPILDECFTALKGKGTYLNGKPANVSANSKLIDSLLATGFPYDVRESEADNMNNFIIFYKKGAQTVRRAGSAALDLAYVACGRFDGFWEFKLHAWDIAAGILLVEEAGGRVTDFEGGDIDLFKGEVLASNGAIHSQMQKIFKEVEKL
ncbi:MAG: inositol monophosphatase [candidate division Zixibacteria bacterium]|nr:inositol monophosphatase [candidate division Zixibacteria bacterium]